MIELFWQVCPTTKKLGGGGTRIKGFTWCLFTDLKNRPKQTSIGVALKKCTLKQTFPKACWTNIVKLFWQICPIIICNNLIKYILFFCFSTESKNVMYIAHPIKSTLFTCFLNDHHIHIWVQVAPLPQRKKSWHQFPVWSSLVWHTMLETTKMKEYACGNWLGSVFVCH